MPRAGGLPGAAAGGAPHGILTGHFVAELESLQHDGTPAELAQPEGGHGENSTEETVEKGESGEDKEEPAAPGPAQERAGRERPGPAGRLLANRLG